MPASLLPLSSKASTGWSLTHSMPPSLEEMANENLSCSHQGGKAKTLADTAGTSPTHIPLLLPPPPQTESKERKEFQA